MSLLQTHIILAAIAYGFYTLSVLSSIGVLAKDLLLRRKKALSGFLPSLVKLERFQFITLLAGTFILYIALLMGWMSAYSVADTSVALEKAALSMLTVVLATFLLWAHFKLGLRGRFAARVTLGVYALILLAYFASRNWIAF